MVKVISKAKHTIIFDKTRISFGENEVQSNQYELMLKHPRFTDRVSAGIFIIPADQCAVEECSDASIDSVIESDGMKVKDVIKAVSNLSDVNALKSMIENEQRVRVIKAIESRLQELEKQGF